VDLDAYRHGDPATRAAECAKAAESLHATGCLYVRDSRVAAADNERFLDLLERYFAASDGKRDARPDLNYQVRWLLGMSGWVRGCGGDDGVD
jgi:hypothetical protein